MEIKLPTSPIRIFYICTYQDKASLDKLAQHLTPLLQSYGIYSWISYEIQPEEQRDKVGDALLSLSNIILLLISPDLIASDYLYCAEMLHALKRHKRGEVRVIPIIVRPTDWGGSPISRLQALPTNLKPLILWKSPDEALLDITESLRSVIETLLPRKLEMMITEHQQPSLATIGDENKPIIADVLQSTQYSVHNTVAQLLQEKTGVGRFDVFLCHNVKDKLSVKKIGQQLKEYGILPWLDEWELRPGFPWQPCLEEHIEQIKAAAVFVGHEGIGPWQRQELNAYLRAFANSGCPVIPVLLETAPTEPKLPLFLQGNTWVDFRQYDPDPWKQLIWGITGMKEYKL